MDRTRSADDHRGEKYFCPGSGGRTYPHWKFENKEAQESKRD